MTYSISHNLPSS
ncbi:hypothetical protein LINPERPRIM_LOCUS36767 [Linum perenne]